MRLVILDPFSLVNGLRPPVKNNMGLTDRSETRASGLFRARFQLHPALLTPVAEAQPMPRRRAHPIAMEHAQRDDCDTEVAEPFEGFFEHRLHYPPTPESLLPKSLPHIPHSLRKSP